MGHPRHSGVGTRRWSEGDGVQRRPLSVASGTGSGTGILPRRRRVGGAGRAPLRPVKPHEAGRPLVSKEQREKPGPNQYPLPDQFTGRNYRSPPSFSIRPRLTSDTANHTISPGPGAYEATPVKSPRAGVTIGVKTRELSKLDVPGPGSYALRKSWTDPEYSRKPKGFSLLGRLEPLTVDPLPSPLDYQQTDAVLPRSPRATFGRSSWPSEKLNPTAPGQYEVSSTLGAHSPRYTMGRRLPGLSQKKNIGPGPAAYSAPKNRVPCCVFGTSQ